jgi:hypothetical protein
MKTKALMGVMAFAAMLLLALPALPASAVGPATTGTWYSYPPQTFTETTSTTTGPTAYTSAVRPPINADGSSNWPAKRGVIPVQFDLLAASATTTTTTKTYDPPVWESLNGVPDSYSFAGLTLSPTITFNEIDNLSADYLFTTGDCFGGSLRWTITVMHNGSPELIHVYYGTPNGPDQGCSGLNSGSGQNLIEMGITPDRFEFQGAGGPVYTTYDAMLALTNDGTDKVLSVQLTLDSGWKADQRANVSDVR